jgi:hypothetical protein
MISPLSEWTLAGAIYLFGGLLDSLSKIHITFGMCL